MEQISEALIFSRSPSGIIRRACSANKTNKRQLEISVRALLRKEEILRTVLMNYQILSSGKLRSKMSLILDQLAFSLALSVLGVAGIWCVRGFILGL